MLTLSVYYCALGLGCGFTGIPLGRFTRRNVSLSSTMPDRVTQTTASGLYDYSQYVIWSDELSVYKTNHRRRSIRVHPC